MACKENQCQLDGQAHSDSKDLPKYGDSSDGRINPKYLNGIKGIRGKLEAAGPHNR